jgi:ParB family chromosome partitioning protein
MKIEGTIKTIPVSQIIVGKRLRPVDADAVKALAESIAQVGLMQPIVVAKTEDADEFTLIAGRHRLAAVKKVGHEEIKCVVRTVASRDEAQVLEIDENLSRKELTAAEEASQLKLRVALWEKIAAASGKKLTGKGKTEAKMSTRELAKKTGKSKDTIARGLKRAKVLGDDLDDVAGTSLDKGEELDALVKVKKADRGKAKQLIAEAKSGKKVSAKSTAKEVAKEQAKAKGSKAVKALDDKALKAGVRDVASAMQRHKDLVGDERWSALCDLFAGWCDENGL